MGEMIEGEEYYLSGSCSYGVVIVGTKYNQQTNCI